MVESTTKRRRKTVSAELARKPRTMKSRRKAEGSHRTSSKRQVRQDISQKKRTLLLLSILILLAVGFFFVFIRPYAYRWKPCYGAKAYGACLPSKYEVHGIDISHHQGAINWEQLQKTQNTPFPIRFVFIKASEGGDFGDSIFQRNFSNARKFGFIRGAYHFYNPATDPDKQADFFIRTAKLESGDLPPMLDVEKVGDSEYLLRKNIKVWLDKVERHYHVKPILYASYKFKIRYLADSVFNDYPYWIAHYYADSVAYSGEWKFWQHTDSGRLPGVNEKVDLDVFNGSLNELKDMAIR